MSGLTDIYGNDDDDDAGKKPDRRVHVNRTGNHTEVMVDGHLVRVPTVDYVDLLERRLMAAEAELRRLGDEMRRVQQSSRRRQSDLDEMRRRLDSRPGTP